MISLNDISISLPGTTGEATTILSGITLEIARGDWIVLAGPNGSGKTTLLKALAGLVPLAAGSIVSGTSANRPLRFSLMLQDPDNQFVASTVRNELLLSAGRDGDAIIKAKAEVNSVSEERIRAAIERFNLADIVARNPHHLSGGEQQRLAMATVWLERPDVLLLDEPVSFLDEHARTQCVEFVHELNQNGATIIWASPGGDELLPAATIVYLEEGTVRFAGSRDRFLLEARTFGGEHSLPRLFRIGEALAAAIGSPDRSGAAGLAERTAARHAPEVLSLREVSFAYRPGLPVINNLSAHLAAGECTGVTGPNGSGKTTLLELAGNILKPDSGSVTMHLQERPHAGAAAPSSLIDCFYLFQGPERMFFAETVYEEIAYGLRKSGAGRDERDVSIADALSHVGFAIDAVRDRSPFRLSFGEMRRLALAIAISLKPRTLLLDEPSACLDNAGMKILKSVLQWCRAEGRTVLVASHDIDFLAEICDRILFLEQGSIAGDLPTGGGVAPPSHSWPGEPRPYVLDLQDVLAEAGIRFPRCVLTPELFVRELLDHAKSDVR